MKFKKTSFFIQMNDYKFEKREGYIDDSGQYTFHKSANGWIGSDNDSGASICWRKTRKACAEFIEEFKEKIELERGKEYVIQAKKRKEEFINSRRDSNE